jgi:transposase-like protein
MEAPSFGRMEIMTNSSGPTQGRYPAELRQRAVRLVREALKETGQSQGVLTRVSVQLGVGSETLGAG